MSTADLETPQLKVSPAAEDRGSAPPLHSPPEGGAIVDQMAKGGVWIVVSRLCRQAIQFAASILLARTLAPTDYGIVGMAAIWSGLLDGIAELGVPEALIQRKELTDTERQTAFWMNLSVCSAIALSLWTAAPFLARFYHQPAVTAVMRVLGVGFIVAAVKLIPYTMLRRDLRFRDQGLIDALKTAVQSGVCVALALAGWGYWALVLGPLGGEIAATIGCYILYPWRPRFIWAARECKQLVRFGGFISSTRVLAYLYDNADYFVVSKLLGPGLLGLYTFAFNWAHLFPDRVVNLLTPVLFPSYSRMKDAGHDVAGTYLKAVDVVTLLVFPAIALFGTAAPLFFTQVLGSKWAGAVAVTQGLLFVSALRCLTMLAPAVLFAIGRVRAPLLYTVVASLALVVAMCIGVRWGLNGIMWAWIAAFPPVGLALLWYTAHVLRRSFAAYMQHVIPGCAIAACVWGVGSGVLAASGQLNPLWRLTILVLGGGCCHLAMVLMVRAALIDRLIRRVTDNRIYLPVRWCRTGL